MHGKSTFVIVQQPIMPHTRQFPAQRGSVHPQIVCQLLAIKRNGKGVIAASPYTFCEEQHDPLTDGLGICIQYSP